MNFCRYDTIKLILLWLLLYYYCLGERCAPLAPLAFCKYMLYHHVVFINRVTIATGVHISIHHVGYQNSHIKI